MRRAGARAPREPVTVRVLVAAASPVARAGLEALLAEADGIAVVGVAAPGDELADAIAAREPDVVLVDVPSRGGASVDPATLLALHGPDARPAPAFVLLADADAGWALDAVRAGARGVLEREATVEANAAAIAGAAAGLTIVRRDALEPLLAERAGTAASAGSVRDGWELASPLTPRETEILRLLADGLANKQVAARLGISEHTVKTHVASLFEKLGADTRAEAVALGVRRGVILL
jgi:DNA-binding NarL/FixJ family response regulator